MIKLLEIIIGVIFALGFLTIIFEEILKMNKAKSALFFGTLAWIVLFLAHHSNDEINHALEETFLEISMLWLFLIAAMTFVAYMEKTGFIEHTVYRILPNKISERKLLLIMGVFAFFFSAVADNLTATLVALTILVGLRIPTDKLIKFAVLIVFSANAGGVALITGDVTTLMIFLAGKVSMSSLLVLVIPAFVSFIILYLLMARNANGNFEFKTKHEKRSKTEIAIALIFLGTIFMVIFGHMAFHIPPVLIFLFGLSIMLLTGWIHILYKKKDLQLFDYIRAIEIDSLFFFLGVLMLVGSIKQVGMLSYVGDLYNLVPTQFANFIVGMLSAVFDNIPLTAALLKSDLELSLIEWLGLTYAVGVGGSLLAVGSAAGVVAMSKIKELTFVRYLKYSGYVLIAYAIGFVGSVLFATFMLG